MPLIRHDIQQLAALGDTYANAAPDLLDFLNNAVITARTLHRQEKPTWTAACWRRPGWATPAKTSSAGAGRIWQRGVADLVPTAQLLDTYSPGDLLHHPQLPRRSNPRPMRRSGGGNGYSLKTMTELMSGLGGILTLPGLACGTLGTTGLLGLAGLVGGAPNPYVYPDNLPRVNARGGPGGAPGCWQPSPVICGPRPSW
jgi:phospholipid/cholesterol/gamma-HCH transport system substrate-binding protein